MLIIAVLCAITTKPKISIRKQVQQQPLYVYKDNIISETKFRNIDSNKIKKVTVLKGEKAFKKYGSKAKYGAIEID